MQGTVTERVRRVEEAKIKVRKKERRRLRMKKVKRKKGEDER